MTCLKPQKIQANLCEKVQINDEGYQFIFLFILNSQSMKSPITSNNQGYFLNLSSVNDRSYSKKSQATLLVNNGDFSDERSFQHNKSSVFESGTKGKDFKQLRKTIGSPTGADSINVKGRFDQFLRNTSYFTNKTHQIDNLNTYKLDHSTHRPHPYQDLDNSIYRKELNKAKQSPKIVENGQTNYRKIMQKIDKKQKLINELKKLSEIKISDKIKNSYDFQRGKGKDNNPLMTQRITINLNSPTLSKPLLADLTGNQDQSVYLKEKVLNKINERKQANVKKIDKNLDEELKKGKYMYYTPKVSKEVKIQTRYTPKVDNNSKDTYSFLNVSDVKLVQKYGKASTTHTSLSRQVFSPTLTQSKVNPPNQVKTMKEIRQIARQKSSKTMVTKNLTIQDFELGKSLGQGKFGTVYQAIHKQTKFLVALKKISKDSIKSNMMIDQFLLEVKIQSFCEHENILKIYGLFDDKDFIYLVLEYMEEGTLFKHLKKSKTFTEQQTAQWLIQVVEAVKYLHQKGIAHRDIKPQNIVISNGVGKLCDFGWAAICNQRRKTYCGTFDYTAPQILQGVQYDMAVDLWCLGVLAYELLVGKAPFYHISRKQTMKKILNVESSSIQFPSSLSKQAVSFIQNLIRKNPEERMTPDNVLKHPFLKNRVTVS